MAETPTLPSPVIRFLELFNDARFWDSHEALEDAWREAGSDFYQGLILFASAWVHWEKENAHGVRAQLGKTLERLHDYPSSYLGFDVNHIRAQCELGRRTVAAYPEDWTQRLLPAPLEVDEERVRGDEDELDG